MSELDKVNDIITSNGYEDVVVFSDPCYADALVGITTNNRAVYDYEKMIECLMKDDGMTAEDAADFIEYNTIGSLGNGGEYGPIVMYHIED